MDADAIRGAFLDYMTEQGHVIIPRAPLIPKDDPTTLFTGSGMQPLLPFLLGSEHPAGTRLADSQTCLRVQDIEEEGEQRLHAAAGEERRRVVLGDERSPGDDDVAPLGQGVEEGQPDRIRIHGPSRHHRCGAVQSGSRTPSVSYRGAAVRGVSGGGTSRRSTRAGTGPGNTRRDHHEGREHCGCDHCRRAPRGEVI